MLYIDQTVVAVFRCYYFVTSYAVLHWKSWLHFFIFVSFVLNYVIDEGVSPLGKTTFQSRLQACKHLGMVCWLQHLHGHGCFWNLYMYVWLSTLQFQNMGLLYTLLGRNHWQQMNFIYKECKFINFVYYRIIKWLK